MLKSFLSKNGLFFLLFITFSVIYYDSILEKGPLGMHRWRQGDCLSLSKMHQEGAPLFEPELHTQRADDYLSGKAAGEFPILYYAVGNIWKVTGESYLAYRIFYLIILFFGTWAFYTTVRRVLKDPVWALGLSLLLFTSPIYVLYGVSFLTDVPAFCFILIALYFFQRYHAQNKIKFFYWAMLFFALGGLVKVSSLIVFVFLGFALLLETFSIRLLKEKPLFHGKKKEWIGMALVLVAMFGWYYYAKIYNETHFFKYTFNHIHPYWIMDDAEKAEVLQNVIHLSSHVFYSRPMIFLLGIIGLVNLFLFRKMSKLAYLANLVIAIGAFTYLILWAPLIGVHDYYYVPFLILVISILGPFVFTLKESWNRVFKSPWTKIVLMLFLVYNFFYCLNVVQLRTLATEDRYGMVKDEDFVERMIWLNSENGYYWHRFERMRPYLEEIGVKKDDKLVSINDFTINTSLFLMGHKGWTEYAMYKNVDEMNFLIKRGAKYMIVTDMESLKEDWVAPFAGNEVGDFEGCKIYKLSPQ